jgi:hypothetical protein
MSADLASAHSHTASNRTEIQRSSICGCGYCLKTFPSSAIERWLNEGDGTAVCPECQIDSVLGGASGYPVNNPDFLQRFHATWFKALDNRGN